MELARALAPHPRLMLLDETLAGLGHDDLDGILGVIRQVRDDGITVLIIEHTMHAMVQLVDHFTVLDHGRLIASGEPETTWSAIPKSSKPISARNGSTGSLCRRNDSAFAGGSMT